MRTLRTKMSKRKMLKIARAKGGCNDKHCPFCNNRTWYSKKYYGFGIDENTELIVERTFVTYGVNEKAY